MGAERLSWIDVEIDYTPLGAPIVHIAREPWNTRQFEVSISHDGGVAAAVAIMSSNNDNLSHAGGNE